MAGPAVCDSESSVAVNTSDWSHSNWRSQPSDALKLAAAMLHEAEVRNASTEQGSGRGRYIRLPENYLRDLVSEIREMQAADRREQNAKSDPTAGLPLVLKPTFD